MVGCLPSGYCHHINHFVLTYAPGLWLTWLRSDDVPDSGLPWMSFCSWGKRETLPDGPPLLLPFTGGLDLAIEGPSKAEISCIDNKDGTCTVTYLPTLPGDYSILVKYNDKHIPGSPFTAKITGRDTWLAQGFLVKGMASPTASIRPGTDSRLGTHVSLGFTETPWEGTRSARPTLNRFRASLSWWSGEKQAHHLEALG